MTRPVGRAEAHPHAGRGAVEGQRADARPADLDAGGAVGRASDRWPAASLISSRPPVKSTTTRTKPGCAAMRAPVAVSADADAGAAASSRSARTAMRRSDRRSIAARSVSDRRAAVHARHRA